MAGWLPILKAVLPHLTTVITSAIPHFSNRGSPDSIPQQIAELQIAATKNAESLRVLAEQVEQIVRATEQGATSLEQALTRIEQTNSALEKRIHDTSARFSYGAPDCNRCRSCRYNSFAPSNNCFCRLSAALFSFRCC